MSQASPRPAATVQTQILELDDADAVRMLRVLLESSQHLPDPETAHDLASHLGEAARNPLLLELPAAGAYSETGVGALTLPRGEAVSSGVLARETLLYLLTEQPELQPLMAGAVATATGPLGRLTRPGHLDLGVQVLLALHEEVRLERGADSTWRFRVRRKAMNDAALVQVLAKLIATVGAARG